MKCWYMYVDVEHKQWHEVLPYVTFAYNTATQESIGIIPFCLDFGREATTMLDAMLRHVDRSITDVAPFLQRAEEVRQLACVRVTTHQHSDAQRYNLQHSLVEHRAGDRVWVWTPVRQGGLSEKLLRLYFGPYLIVRRARELNYEVVSDGNEQSRARSLPEVVHVVRLEPYYVRQDNSTASLPYSHNPHRDSRPQH